MYHEFVHSFAETMEENYDKFINKLKNIEFINEFVC